MQGKGSLFLDIREGLVGFHGLLEGHAGGDRLLACAVDSLNLLHLFAGQTVALHGDERRDPCEHRDDAEHDDDGDLDAGGIRGAVGRQLAHARRRAGR